MSDMRKSEARQNGEIFIGGAGRLDLCGLQKAVARRCLISLLIIMANEREKTKNQTCRMKNKIQRYMHVYIYGEKPVAEGREQKDIMFLHRKRQRQRSKPLVRVHIGFTYEFKSFCRVFEAGGGTGRPLKTSNHSVSFYSLKDSQTSLLRRRRGRI